MVQQGVISPVIKAIEWCSGMVPVLKLSRDVRVCVDMTGLNKAVRIEIYPMPAVDESIGMLGASQIFSKLDANSPFRQMHLQKELKKLIIFLTPFGQFCFNRFLFGISSAPEIFVSTKCRLLGDIENVIRHMDEQTGRGKAHIE